MRTAAATDDDDQAKDVPPPSRPRRFRLGMRKCLLDQGAADALAAAAVGSRNVDLVVDVAMNDLDRKTVRALAGDDDEDEDGENHL